MKESNIIFFHNNDKKCFKVDVINVINNNES